MKKGRIIGVVLAVVIIALVVSYSPKMISSLQSLTSNSSYTSVKVVQGQPSYYDEGKNEWGFAWRFLPTDSPNAFLVTSGLTSEGFPVTEGATYRAFGLEIRVSEVHTDYIVLLVKTV